MSATALLCLLSAVAAVENGGFTNLDFEQGAAGWGVWYSDNPTAPMVKYPYAADPTVAHGGRQSMRIEAPSEQGLAFVNRSAEGMQPGNRYEVSYWIRTTPELDERAFKLQFNFRPAAAGAGWVMQSASPLVTVRRTEGEWRFRAGSLSIPKDASTTIQLGLYLREARGTIWIDDIRIREIPASEYALADLWIYDPHRVELGNAPITKFNALKVAHPELVARAQRYNELLVSSADRKEDVRRVARLAGYGLLDGAPAVALSTAMDQAEVLLAAAYRAYGEAYLAPGDGAKLTAFDFAASRLETALGEVASSATSTLAQATAAQRQAGARWTPPPPPPNEPLTMAPDGSVRRIIYGNRSSAEWQELERPLRFDPLHSTVTGTPSSSAPGQYDWSGHLQEWENIKKQGAAEKSCLLLFMALHDNCYTPKWLADRFAADPELRHVLQPPGELADRSGRQQLNWWHPAIRDYARELVSHMGRTFRERDDFLFYLFQWESYGPNVSAATGTREVGYGRYAEQDFRRWLAARYGDIGRLNARWRSNHASFEAIAPPPDRYVTERRRTDPLTAEWEAWREDSYYDWCKLIYQEWKAADPNKPVMSGHNMLLRPFNGARLYETCDTVSWHSGGGDFMPGTAYVHSLSRYNGHRPLAQYENFWGIQEDHDRMSEELPKRHAAVKYLFRLTAWDRFLQVWWYSYTSAPYLTVYDGNYFDPSYALTTLRYRSAALPVYFDKFRRLQRTLLDSKVVPSRICLLAPSASNRNNWPYDASQKEGRDLFWALFERNHLVEYLPEEYLLDGRARLSDFDAVILPYALYLAEPLQERLAAWLRGGGKLLLAAGPAGLYDELGLDSGKLLREVFGNPTLTAMEAPTGRWQWRAEPAGGDGIVRARVGTSEAILLTEPAADLKSRGALPGLLAAIEQAAPRPVRDRRDQLELVFREAGATRYLLALNPSLDNPVETVVEVRGRYARATDLDYPEGISVPVRCEDEWTRFPLRLAPGEATILRLEP